LAHGPTLPRRAGRHAQYTENRLQAFGRRQPSHDNALMYAVAARLADLERQAVAACLSGLQ
jgi:cytochrome c553